MCGLGLWSLSSLWTIGLKKEAIFLCIRLYQGNFHQNGRMSTDPFSAPLLFWSCFIKKFFFFFFMLLLHFVLSFFPRRRKCSDRDECERDIWGKHSPRHHNTHAGNSEHIYHFSWRFVQFSSVQLGASVPKDAASCVQGRSHNTSLHFRGDSCEPSESEPPSKFPFCLLSHCFGSRSCKNTHTQIDTLVKVVLVHQCDTTRRLMGRKHGFSCV